MRAKQVILSTAALIAPATLIATPAAAQSIVLDPPPIRLPIDDHGVDLASGQAVYPSSTIAIGAGNGLQHTRYRVANGWRHNFLMTMEITQGQSSASINLGGSRQTFSLNGVVYESDQGTGATITPNFTTGNHVYTDRDGTQIFFTESYVNNGSDYYGTVDALAEEIVRPNGGRVNLHYRQDSYQLPSHPGNGFTVYVVRLQSVTNNNGYQLKFSYSTNFPSFSNIDSWYQISNVTAINNAIEYCDPMADSCSLTNTWPSLDYAISISGSDTLETVTDVLGRQARFRTDASDRLAGIKRPSETSDGIVIAYDTNSRVSSITSQGTYTRTYAWAVGTNTLQATASDSLGRMRTTIADTAESVIISDKNALNEETNFEYDPDGLLEAVEAPEGQRTEYTYDTRGNVTEVKRIAKPGSGLTAITSTATYAPSCSNPVTCNKPITTTDTNGNITNYTYNSSHGGLTKVELPADNDGNRPTTEITYITHFARRKNSSGTLVTESTSITMPSEVTGCRIAATCPGSANERVIQTTYNNSLSPNLNPVSITSKAGNGTLAGTTSFTYTALGNVLTLDGPLTGTGDTTTSRYDAAGQIVGTILPDPDGAGSLQQMATRYTYNDDGQVTVVENGHVTGTSETDWSNFTVHTKAVSTYDGFGRLETSFQPYKTGNTQYSLTQYSYDLAGRLECAAVRMNAPYTTTVLPSSACTPMTAGVYGEDRIVQRYYDAADRVTEVWAGVGTSLAQQSAEMSYNANGTIEWIEDAADNRTTYLYDGFDRQYRTSYPNPTTPNTSAGGDYEQLTFDAAGRVQTFRTRDGRTFNYTYDDLGRVVLKHVPTRSGLAATHTRDVYFDYDLFGNVTDARFDSSIGEGVTFAYDGLGRPTSTTQNLDGTSRTISFQYDVANRRSRITHPDGAWWGYEYDDVGRLSRIRDDDAVSLVHNQFFNWGSLNRRNRDGSAPNEHYQYDGAERLNRIMMDHSSASFDVNRRYTNNPANQAIDEEIDNQLYVWGNHPAGSVDTDYIADGLNQYDSVDAAAFSYDLNGNLTFDGDTTYVYDTENRLVDASGANNADLRYDPLGRLYEIKDGSGNITRLLYDGDALIAEYDGSGTMQSRYVHGVAAGDDPLVQYAGSNPGYYLAEHLYSDRLGSIVAAFRRSGSGIAINSYDEFGVPGTSAGAENKGRFRYTGQIWIPELGQYHYKARAYSPGLGRFMQTDPIGYSDGLNMYAYVGNDPINAIDPSGLERCYRVTVRSNTSRIRIDTADYVQCVGGGGGGVPPSLRAVGGRELSFGNTGRRVGGVARPDTAGNTAPQSDKPCPAVPSEVPGYLYADPALGIDAAFATGAARRASAARFPNLGGTDDVRDAYRHFYGAITLARKAGGSRALGALNGNEFLGWLRGYSAASRAMDDHNNYVGVVMAEDPRFADMSAAQAADYALSNGCLVTSL